MADVTGILAIIMVFGIPLTLIIGTFVIIGMVISRSGTSKNARKLRTEETQTIQQMYHGFSNLEKRIESLETILLDRAQKDKEEIVSRKG